MSSASRVELCGGGGGRGGGEWCAGVAVGREEEREGEELRAKRVVERVSKAGGEAEWREGDGEAGGEAGWQLSTVFLRRPAANHRGGHGPRQAGYGPYCRGEADADGAAFGFRIFLFNP